MAKKYKAKYVSADEYNTKKNYVSPEEYAQLKRQRQSEQERQRKLRKQAEEKRAREESFNRTKEWQQRYKDAKYSPDGDQSWQIYAAKQILDTPGALEKEQERQREIGRRNMMMVQSNFGTPTRGGTLKNELTEKAGPYRTQQKALNNYIEALKQNKANKERSPIVD